MQHSFLLVPGQHCCPAIPISGRAGGRGERGRLGVQPRGFFEGVRACVDGWMPDIIGEMGFGLSFSWGRID